MCLDDNLPNDVLYVITAPLIVVMSLSRRRVDLDEDGGDGGVAPLLRQPLRLVQLEVRVRRRRCRGGAIFEKMYSSASESLWKRICSETQKLRFSYFMVQQDFHRK